MNEYLIWVKFLIKVNMFCDNHKLFAWLPFRITSVHECPLQRYPSTCHYQNLYIYTCSNPVNRCAKCVPDRLSSVSQYLTYSTTHHPNPLIPAPTWHWWYGVACVTRFLYLYLHGYSQQFPLRQGANLVIWCGVLILLCQLTGAQHGIHDK
jgi:hypothetical protein